MSYHGSPQLSPRLYLQEEFKLKKQKVETEQQPKENKSWIAFAFGACISFTICNSAISEISNQAGPACLFYFASGSIVTGIAYHLIKCCREKTLWNNQNIIVDGQFKLKNLIGFVCYCLIYLLIQLLAIYTMYFANKAGVNVGIITTIWSLNPLFMATADFFIFGQPLKHYHYQGLISILICSVVISLSGMANAAPVISNGKIEPTVPTWIPVLFGIVTPVSFTMSGIMTKHLSSERVGFDI